MRALAVLSVVGYHYFPGWIKGGFVGVDIFFVISGYLISGILLDNLKNNNFSIINFYQRRILRILPALILVMFFVLVFGWFALLPDDYAQLGKHILGGATFISNFILYFEAGYWDAASHTKPLLHLWSLGVEEQFYIIFPVILFVLYKLSIRTSLVIALLLIISFALNLYYYKVDMTLDFYMPFTRFWELMAGSLVATAQRGTLKFFAPDCKPTLKTILSFIGFALMITAIVSSRAKSFPGINAFAPVLGASLFILAGGSSLLNRYIFSLKPIVFIGLISFPLYLWHWSLISYTRIITADEVSAMPLFKWILIGVAVVLAIATYYLIERPIRFSKNYRDIKAIILVILLVIIGAMGIGIYYKNGIEDRWVVREMGGGNRAAVLNEIKRGSSQRDAKCINKYGFGHISQKRGWACALDDVNGSSTTVLIGDSHSMAIYNAVKIYNAKQGVNTVLFAQHSAGNPIEDVSTNRYFIEGYSEQVFLAIQHDPSITKVFVVVATDLHSKNPDQLNVAKLQSAIDIISAADREIFIVAQHPFLPHDIKAYLFTHPFWRGYKNLRYLTRLEMLEKHTKSHAMLSELKGATIIYTVDTFCPIDQCLLGNDNGLPLYFDMGHLSINAGGNFMVEKVLKPYLDK